MKSKVVGLEFQLFFLLISDLPGSNSGDSDAETAAQLLETLDLGGAASVAAATRLRRPTVATAGKTTAASSGTLQRGNPWRRSLNFNVSVASSSPPPPPPRKSFATLPSRSGSNNNNNNNNNPLPATSNNNNSSSSPSKLPVPAFKRNSYLGSNC